MTDKVREEFEAWWSATMNIEEMDLWRCEYPLTKEENQPYACHETQRSWMAWKASRESIKAEAPFKYQLLPSVESVVSEIKANVIEPRHSK